VDLKRGELHVRQRADRYNAMGKPKSAAGERTVPLPPILLNTLKEHRLGSRHELVFANGKGNIESTSNIVKRGLKRAWLAEALWASTAGCTVCGIFMPAGASTGASMVASNYR
jgi:integrase